MGTFLRFWLMNAILLAAAIAIIRTAYSRLGGEIDIEYTLREILSIAVASLAFTVVYSSSCLTETSYVGFHVGARAALFTPACIAMMFLYKRTHIVEIEGAEGGDDRDGGSSQVLVMRRSSGLSEPEDSASSEPPAIPFSTARSAGPTHAHIFDG